MDHPIQSLRETAGSRFVVTRGTVGDVEDSWEFSEFEAALGKLFDEVADVRDKPEPRDIEDPWSDPNYYLKTLQEEYWSTQ